jgi:hypothetical protein
VENKFVCFLYARGRIAFHDKIDIADTDGRATVTTEQRDCFESALLSFLERAPNVL